MHVRAQFRVTGGRQRRRKERLVRPHSRYMRLSAVVAALALVGVACGGGSDKSSKDQQGSTQGAKQGGVFRIGVVEPTAIDPYNAQESEGLLVTKELFTGLVDIDNATAQIKPGVAEKWTHNGDCTEWT